MPNGDLEDDQGGIDGGAPSMSQQPPPSMPQAAVAPSGATQPLETPVLGSQAPKRHGGLLTGLVGVLLDGMTAGMTTPQSDQGGAMAAQRAMQLPQQRQQQQQQRIDFQTKAELQKAQIAQAHVQQMQAVTMMAHMNDEFVSGMSQAAAKYANDAVTDGRAQQIGEGTREAAMQRAHEERMQKPDTALQIWVYPTGHDANGMPNKFGVFEAYPKNTLQKDAPYTFPGNKDIGGKIDEKKIVIPAGTDQHTSDLKFSLEGRNQAGIVEHDNDRMAKLEEQANKDKPVKTDKVPRTIGGQEHTILVNAETGEDIKDLGPFKPAGVEKPEKAEDMVIGTLNGKQVAGTMEELKAAGATGRTKAGAAEAEKVQNARSLINVFDSNDPDDPGLTQMAADLDKKGKLGPAAATFAEWLNKGKTAANFNAGDPEVQRLFTKMGLATTGLMQVHVGARGSAQMLEHFEELAKAKEMSPNAFRAALDTETRYVRMKAMRPDDVRARFGRDMKAAERKAKDSFAQFGGAAR